jgi:hypothetical protein
MMMNKFSFTYRMLVGCQSRSFANPVKLSNTKFLQRELRENPEFFKAFPHLAPADMKKGESKKI